MFCSISGGIPEEPVLNTRSGHLYERRLITKVVEQTGRDPVTQDETALVDLVPVRSNRAIKPRPVGATSVGGMLSLLTSEYDAILLESYKLRTELEATRSELSQALYQHDAACRVIARLIRERDSARSALAAAQSSAASRGGEGQSAAAAAAAQDEAMAQGGAEASASGGSAAAPPGITEPVLAALKDRHKELSKLRKKRVLPAETATVEAVSQLALARSFTPHAVSPPGISALDAHPSVGGLLATGGADKAVLVYDTTGSGRVVSRLLGHAKRVSSVAWGAGTGGEAATAAGAPSLLLSGSHDETVRIWRPVVGEAASAAESSPDCVATLLPHSRGAQVTAVCAHPLAAYAASAASDGSWAFLDVSAGRVVAVVAADAAAAAAPGLVCARFHPDGMLLAAGAADASVRVFDVRTQTVAATFQGHSAAVSALSFSENGFYMASGGGDGLVKLWDLRKLASFAGLGEEAAGAPGVASLAFDHTGLFLAAGYGAGAVRVWNSKEWAPVFGSEAAHAGAVTGVAWGAHAKQLYTASMDRALKVFAVPA